MFFIQSDGGASRTGMTERQLGGCCFPRAVCNALGRPDCFGLMWDACAHLNAVTKQYELLAGYDPSQLEIVGKRNLDQGTLITPRLHSLMRELGFEAIGVSNDVHLPLESFRDRPGRFVVALRAHATAVVGGCLVDAFDCQHQADTWRYGVYGYWRLMTA